MIRDFLAFLGGILFSSCSYNSNLKLYEVLLLDKNKTELEEVLDHYSTPDDSLKLKAAIFLIENLPEQYSYKGNFINKFRDEVNIYQELSYFSKKVLEFLPYRYNDITKFLQREYDIDIIKADFLIHHIDFSFNLLNENPWLKLISFEDFCEYVLPYRVHHEVLDISWKDSLRKPLENSVREIIAFYDDKKYSSYHWNRSLSLLDNLNYVSKDIYIGDIQFVRFECQNASLAKLLFFRAIGVPAALEHVPAWGNSNGHHYWVTIVDPRLRDIKFEEIVERKAPKIYRRTYSCNMIPTPHGNEFVPCLFQDPFYLDVTNRYMNTSDVLLTINENITRYNEYGYLAVFNDLVLRPVCWGKITNNTVYFKEMGRDIVYFPIFYQGRNVRNLDYPFILYANGKMHRLVPSVFNYQKICLSRKFPINSEKAIYGKRLIGGYFECSNDILFKRSEIVHTITNNPNMMCISVKIQANGKYRYWRYCNNQESDVAQIEFINNGKVLQGKILNKDSTLSNICDNNPLTYSSVSKMLLVDMGQPVSVDEIKYLPRNDANGIYENNEYELFYYDIDGWKSLGCQTSQNNYIIYDSVPSNALFWLHNKTTGKEERIFTYENGYQHFW